MSVSTTSYNPLTLSSSSKLTLEDIEALLTPTATSTTNSSDSRSSIPSSIFRALTRAAHAELNETKERVRIAKSELERADVRCSIAQKERRTVAKLKEALEQEPNVQLVDLLPYETFQAEASEELRASIPATDTEFYEQEKLYARLQFELQEIQSREQMHAQLLQQLSATRAEADHLKKRAILADQALEELKKGVEGVRGKLEDVRLPEMATTATTDDSAAA